MKSRSLLLQSVSTCVFAAFGLAGSASGALTMTDLTNVTLAASQTETGGDTSDNPDVTGGLGGVLVSYTEIGTNAYGCCGGRLGPFGVSNLNDGDVGAAPTNQDGSFAIPDSGPGAVNIGFSLQLISGIAIYNGYTNRDDGDYVLRDGAGNLLGAWSIVTGLGASNDGADSFWLTFNTPVMTDRLVIDATVGPIDNSTPSFREIQVFAVPEPSATLAMLAGLTCLVIRRRRGVRD